ncbi:hypothetical protein BJ322DRAFT_1106575 [Thelephora terrestris]|uniref:Uncharacterized protein n=1 Tax=Thelephora terrestris TaxID=56493 RepID=A0A9P6HJL1_9AGAM|nr:hypothetical protein BJ322DRAFT_1106575 [Thelephora terrestris]
MQAAYMPATTTNHATWRRVDPANISTANASMPPHPPQGYQGPWPPQYPPGYPGPPPAQLPSSVNAQQWSKGYWRFDPKATGWSSASGAPPQPPPQQQQQYYNPGVVNNNVPRPASQQAGGPPGWPQNWMPQGWQMPADHNPYKRTPKEPDPSYFSFELSENPLGLEGMHIACVFDEYFHNFLVLIAADRRRQIWCFCLIFSRESRPQEKPFTTPWRWVPEDLPPSDSEEEGESTPPNGHRPPSSRNDPNSTHRHHISSASQQALGYPPRDPNSQQHPSSREAEQYRLKGVKSPPIRESDQHRPDTQLSQKTSSPLRDGPVSSSSTAAYPSSRRNTQEQTPSKDSSLYRSSSRRNAQEHTPPSDSSPHRSTSRRNTQEYTPPSDDQRRPSTLSQVHTHDDRNGRERDRDRERENGHRRSSDSDEQAHEAFSGKRDLHPTFSPAIVRTPKYYSERTSTPSNATPTKSSSMRRASDGPGVPPQNTVLPALNRIIQENVPSVLSPLIGATPRPSSATMPGLDKVSRGELSSSSSSSSPSSAKDKSSRTHSRNHSRSSSLSKADERPRRSLQRSDTITPRTMSPTHYEEQPHPPVYHSSSSSASMQQPSRTVGRSQTYPSLDPVSENTYPSTRDSREGRESRNPPANISRASDAVKDLARSQGRTVGRSYTDPQPFYNPSRATSPLRARSPTRALSPPRSATPSRSSSRAPSRSHTPTSSAVVVPPGPVPPLPVEASHRYRSPSSAPRKITVRRGYWNRRGDCLTSDRKSFVRAPPKYQYPKEFSHYNEREFYRYDGKKYARTPEMKECPESLSYHGRPPRYPFESYLQYIEVNESDVWRGY